MGQANLIRVFQKSRAQIQVNLVSRIDNLFCDPIRFGIDFLIRFIRPSKIHFCLSWRLGALAVESEVRLHLPHQLLRGIPGGVGEVVLRRGVDHLPGHVHQEPEAILGLSFLQYTL